MTVISRVEIPQRSSAGVCYSIGHRPPTTPTLIQELLACREVMMRRREFITLLGGAAAWPLPARAQQADRIRRIGVLIPLNADDKVVQDRVAAFVQGLKELGWIEGRNVQFDIRFGAGVATTLKQATEMAALAPEVILANGSAAMGPLLQVTSIVPIVFVIVPDPVGAGYVASLA